MCLDNDEQIIAKPKILSLNCPERQGQDERCSGCPLLEESLCAQFIEYVSDFIKNITNSQLSSTGTANGESSRPRAENDENIFNAFQKLLLKVEQNFSYNASGSFKGWLERIFQKILLDQRRNYARLTRPLQDVLQELHEYNIKILTGADFLIDSIEDEKILLKARTARYAFVPTDHLPKYREEALLVINVENRWLQVMSLQPNRSILAHGQVDIQDISERMVQNNGILFWMNEQLSARQLRVIKARSKDKPVPITDAIYGLKDIQQATCLAGEELLPQRQIEATIILHGGLPSDQAPSLLIIDTREREWLQILSGLNSMSVLLYGSIKPPAEIISQLEKNNWVVFWIPEDLPQEVIRIKVQNIFRQYLDVILLTPVNNEEESEPTLPEFSDPNYKRFSKDSERAADMERCLEKAMTDENLNKCAAFYHHYLMICRECIKNPAQKDVFHGNGEIKKGEIYKILGKEYGKQPLAIRQIFSRCLRERSLFKEYLRECMSDHETNEPETELDWNQLR